MFKYISLACFLFILSATCLAQADPVALAKAQKTLKSRLLSDAPAVNSVRFDACRVSIKSGGSSVWAPSQSTGEATRTGYFADVPSLSAGPDRLVYSKASDHYTIDFSILDINRVLVRPTRSKDRSSITVVNDPTGVVTARRP